MQCSYCHDLVHVNCLPCIFRDDPLYTERHINRWLCISCSNSVFPFNHFEEDIDFLSALSEYWVDEIKLSCEDFRDKVFIPFEFNIDEKSPLFDTDPDIHFYNTVHGLNLKHCNYYIEDSFNDKCSQLSISSQNLSLIHTNIRSAPKNLSSFETYLQNIDTKFTVVGLTETWMTQDNVGLYGIDGYNAVNNFRINRCGGGVSVLIRDDIEYFERPHLNMMTANAETVFVEIDKSYVGKSSNIIVGVIYRPPDTNINVFTELLETIMSKIKTENKVCYLLGDYNINLLNAENHPPTQEFVDTMFSHSLFPCITKPTRVNSKTATLIDNIFSNDLIVEDSISGIFYTDITDHFPVFLIDYSTNVRTPQEYIRSRRITPDNLAAFQGALRTHDWSAVIGCTDAQQAYSAFHSQFVSLYSEYFPVKNVKVGYKTKKPWLSEVLKNSIKFKNKLFLRQKNSGNPELEQKYKIYRNKLTSLLKQVERSHYDSLLRENKNNLKKSWWIIREVLN